MRLFVVVALLATLVACAELPILAAPPAQDGAAPGLADGPIPSRLAPLCDTLGRAYLAAEAVKAQGAAEDLALAQALCAIVATPAALGPR